MRRLSGLALLALALFCGYPAWPQITRPTPSAPSRTFYIRGNLRNADDMRPLEMIKLDLRRITGETVNTTFTRSNGEFEFVGLPNGLYLLIVEEKEFEPIRESIEILNSSRNGVALFLKRPLEMPGTRPGGATVSARELSIPRKAHSAMQRGMERLNEKKDAPGSIAFFEKAIAELPDYYEAYHQLGMAYLRQEQPVPAEAAFRKSIDLSQGRWAEPQFALASLLSNAGNFEEAEPLARRGLETDANAWYGYYELGRAQLGLNRLDAAEKNLLEARSRQKDYPQLHLVLANLHIRKKDHPALLEDLDNFLRLDANGPNSAQARQTRENLQRTLAKAQNAPPPAPPKP